MSYPDNKKIKTGIALLNFGGPWTLDDVKPFLYKLFVNPAVLVGVPTPIRQLIAYTITQVKGPSSIESYKLIGGGSPQLKWTEVQAHGLRELTGESVRIEIGMRSAEPSIECALRKLKEWGAGRLILFPLFPHFSTTTSGTCFQEAQDALKRLDWHPIIREITSWPDDSGYTALMRQTVDEAIAQAEADRGTSKDPIHILFSAHSLPMKIVKLGDPYPSHIDRTIKAVTKDLNHPWSLCFQSRNGKMPWLQPYLEDEIKRLALMGIHRFVVVPVSFVSDHIETLFELDKLYADQAKQVGVTHYYRSRSFNGDLGVSSCIAFNIVGGGFVIGRIDSTWREVTIVGAGIAGMLAAKSLDQKGYDVTLLEGSSRSGGLISTRKTAYGIAESAAHSIIATPEVRKLCQELGVELREVKKDSRARYIVRDGKLRKFPLTVGEAASAVGHAVFARAGNHLESQTLGTWGRRHLGKAALQYLLTPFVRGIYGLQPEEVGLAAAFPSLVVQPGRTLLGTMIDKSWHRPKKSEGKKKDAGKGMVAPLYGMGDLIGRLEKHLEQRLGTRFLKGVRVEGLPDAPNIVLAVPSIVAADLIASESSDLSSQLRNIQYTPLVSVTAFVDRSAFTRPVRGVGALVAAGENRKCLGILFTSSSFEGRVVDESRYASFTILFGGTSQPEWISATDDEINQGVREELSSLLGIEGKPLSTVISRWPRAIPRYSTKLPEIWHEAERTWCAEPGRVLFGNYTGQVSLRGMIESAAAMG